MQNAPTAVTRIDPTIATAIILELLGGATTALGEDLATGHEVARSRVVLLREVAAVRRLGAELASRSATSLHVQSRQADGASLGMGVDRATQRGVALLDSAVSTGDLRANRTHHDGEGSIDSTIVLLLGDSHHGTGFVTRALRVRCELRSDTLDEDAETLASHGVVGGDLADWQVGHFRDVQFVGTSREAHGDGEDSGREE